MVAYAEVWQQHLPRLRSHREQGLSAACLQRSAASGDTHPALVNATVTAAVILVVGLKSPPLQQAQR